MKKTLPLVALLLLAVMVGILVSNMEQKRRIAAYEESLITMTPEECIHAYVEATVRQDEVFLRALVKEKDNITFDFSPSMTQPKGVVKISEKIEDDGRLAAGNGRAAFDAILEFQDKTGDVFEASCIFCVRKANRRFSMAACKLWVLSVSTVCLFSIRF